MVDGRELKALYREGHFVDVVGSRCVELPQECSAVVGKVAAGFGLEVTGVAAQNAVTLGSRGFEAAVAVPGHAVE